MTRKTGVDDLDSKKACMLPKWVLFVQEMTASRRPAGQAKQSTKPATVNTDEDL